VGHLIFYQGGVVAANSHMPTPIVMSSSEAEYLAAAAAAMTAAIIHSILYDMRYLGTHEYTVYETTTHFPTGLLCVDNSATVAIAKSLKLTKKTRHIERHYHYVRDGVQRGFLQLNWIPKTAQLADILTKTQGSGKIFPLLSVFMYSLPDFLVAQSSKGDRGA
jgi:hypothetical protein